ncbi:MAG: site-2 protease family protein, partial [bacterium]|nr:site-2 protease family protein [bacterium]
SGLDSVGFFPTEPLIVGEVQNDSPASRAGFVPGDEILEIDGVSLPSAWSFREAMQKLNGKNADVLVRRDKAVLHLAAAAAYNEKEKVWQVGLIFHQDILETSLPPRQALKASWHVNTGIIKTSSSFIRGLFAGTSSPTLMAGPIRIAKMSGEVAQLGALQLLAFAALISTSLGFMNFLPIPALDGGVMLVLLIEMVLRRDFGLRFKIALQYAGTACILFLAAFAIINDLGVSELFFPMLILGIICFLLFRFGARILKRKNE